MKQHTPSFFCMYLLSLIQSNIPSGIFLSRRYSEASVLIITPTGGSQLTNPVFFVSLDG